MADHADGPTRPSSGAYIQHLVLRVRDLESCTRLLHPDPRLRAVRRARAREVPGLQDALLPRQRRAAPRSGSRRAPGSGQRSPARDAVADVRQHARRRPHRHVLSRPRLVVEPDRLDEVAGRRVPNPRQPRHDAQRLRRGPRRQRHRGACTTFPTKCGRATSTPRSTTSRSCRSTVPSRWSTTPTTWSSRPPATRPATRQHRVDQRVRRCPVGVHQGVMCSGGLRRSQVVALVQLVARAEPGADEVPRQPVDAGPSLGVHVVGTVDELLDQRAQPGVAEHRLCWGSPTGCGYRSTSGSRGLSGYHTASRERIGCIGRPSGKITPSPRS